MITRRRLIIIIVLFFFYQISYAQDLIAQEIQDKVGIRFYQKVYSGIWKIPLVFQREFLYERYFWRKKDTLAVSSKSYFDHLETDNLEISCLIYLHSTIELRDILADLVINSQLDTLNIIFSKTEFSNRSGITYWEDNKMDTVYSIRKENFKNYSKNKRRLVFPNPTYAGMTKQTTIKFFFEHFNYRDSQGILHTANSFDEWISKNKLNPANSNDINFNSYFYIKIHIPKDKLKFEFLDFAIFTF